MFKQSISLLIANSLNSKAASELVGFLLMEVGHVGSQTGSYRVTGRVMQGHVGSQAGSHGIPR